MPGYMLHHTTGAPSPNVFSKMTKWPSDLYPKNMWIHSFSMPYAIKKGHFLSDLSFLKKWPFIKKQKTLALLINILNIAPILFSTSLCRNFRYKKHTHFLGFDIPISFRTHSDIIPKARNHQKLTIIWGQKRTTFSPSVFAFISAPHPLSQKNRKFAPTNINNWSFWFRRGRAESPTSA